MWRYVGIPFDVSCGPCAYMYNGENQTDMYMYMYLTKEHAHVSPLRQISGILLQYLLLLSKKNYPLLPHHLSTLQHVLLLKYVLLPTKPDLQEAVASVCLHYWRDSCRRSSLFLSRLNRINCIGCPVKVYF